LRNQNNEPLALFVLFLCPAKIWSPLDPPLFSLDPLFFVSEKVWRSEDSIIKGFGTAFEWDMALIDLEGRDPEARTKERVTT